MKTSTGFAWLAAVALLAGASGCATTHQSDTAALQGTWAGHELVAGADAGGQARLIVTGNKLEYHGANPDDWGNGTYTLREDTKPKQINFTYTECPNAEFNGKTSFGIYRIENGTFTATAFPPGDPGRPTAFDATGARSFEFKKQ